MGTQTVVKAENVSKLYRLGIIGMGTLSHDLKRWWALRRGKEDPYLKIGTENDTKKKNVSDYSWALRDINFEINQGDTLGIIGKNGAGKSTLLKILSRVTSPTEGTIRVRGRIASLLEVGTGFHPELTGRENIFMNGAILGMTKKEITRKFDEIVDFSGVELYIDTPVKRYSSGMYVRLAFAVAAHLEPEILIVDEVLAVGDAEFQKKCLGKMGEVANDGRTIIFVSHNMQAVQSLCKTAMYLKAGQLIEIGSTDKVINNYLSREVKNCIYRKWALEEAPGNDKIRILQAELAPYYKKGIEQIDIGTAFDFKVRFYNYVGGTYLNLSLLLYSITGNCIFNLCTESIPLSAGEHHATLKIPAHLMNDDMYNISLLFVQDTSIVLHAESELLTFEIIDEPRDGAWFGKWPGAVRPNLDFALH